MLNLSDADFSISSKSFLLYSFWIFFFSCSSFAESIFSCNLFNSSLDLASTWSLVSVFDKFSEEFGALFFSVPDEFLFSSPCFAPSSFKGTDTWFNNLYSKGLDSLFLELFSKSLASLFSLAIAWFISELSDS